MPHSFLELSAACFTGILPVLLAQLFMHRQNRKAKIETDQKFSFLLKEFPMHKHDEVRRGEAGPLMVAGVVFPVNGSNPHK